MEFFYTLSDLPFDIDNIEWNAMSIDVIILN